MSIAMIAAVFFAVYARPGVQVVGPGGVKALAVVYGAWTLVVLGLVGSFLVLQRGWP